MTGGPGCGHWGDSGKILEVEPTKVVDGVDKGLYGWEKGIQKDQSFRPKQLKRQSIL